MLWLAYDLFEGLVSSSPHGKTIPGVATHWVTQDAKTYTFYLRSDAKWSDGKPVTAEDFVFAWQRAVDPAVGSPYAWYVASTGVLNAQAVIDGKLKVNQLGIKAKDEHTLVITLAEPKSYLPSMLSHPTLFPAPKHVVEKYGETWTQPRHMVSNGAYQLKEWTVNERIVLERNPYYWDNAHTSINEVVYLQIKSQNIDLQRFQANEVHISYEIPFEHFKQLRAHQPQDVKVYPFISLYYYTVNRKRPPFNDVRVRKALAYAIDRQRLTQKVLGQGELPAYTMIPEVTQNFSLQLPQWAKWTQAERNQHARTLLKAAGFDAKHPLRFELLYNTSDNHKKVAVAIASMWKQVLGCQVTLVNQEWKTYLETRRQHHFDVARAGWIADYNEGIAMLEALSRDNPNNDTGFNDPKYEALLDQSRRSLSTKKRSVLYHQAEAILNEDMPIIPIYQYVKARMVKSYLQGFGSNPLEIEYSKNLSFASSNKAGK